METVEENVMHASQQRQQFKNRTPQQGDRGAQFSKGA
jgi:hypothetical protein